uniref:AlNc14C73G4959 protein n=1 Tax=Albugo laibachii Nc14 TaxID=890382 RepID=F0WEA2_9STRA|nr:AlNc14C73G4959 [Albugo laibachii Nc14]|eukprot:CCA19533.1 AlNc14C73G4959 [Albugo laibachii Nc14]
MRETRKSHLFVKMTQHPLEEFYAPIAALYVGPGYTYNEHALLLLNSGSCQPPCALFHGKCPSVL